MPFGIIHPAVVPLFSSLRNLDPEEKKLVASCANIETPPVWPHPNGTSRGEGLVPLYRSVPDAALRDPTLYEWLALIDAVRSGRARERQLAVAEIESRLS